MIDFTPDLN
jgi:hypothetical protein